MHGLYAAEMLVMSLPLPELGVLTPAALLVCLLCNRNKNISGQSLLEDEG